ncbi:Hypothetical protein A7982_06013 [Minicystis rosea]|nr:Hypothetical protein A7982_06013 [Minicystis rosea]
MSTSLAEAVQALADAVTALPKNASTEAVTASLQRALGLLAHPTPPRAADVAPMIQGAAHVLMRLAAEGTEVPLEAAARAANALREDPDRAVTLAAQGRDRAPDPAWPRATRSTPVLLRPNRDVFRWPGATSTDLELAEDDLEEAEEPALEARIDAPREIGPDAPEPALRPPANDVAMPAAPKPRLRLGEGGERLPSDAFPTRALGTCLDGIAMLAQQRRTRDLADRSGAEARLLAYADAAAITGTPLVARVLAWWEASLDRPDPSASWAAAFFLGLLDGDDALLAVLAGVEKLPGDAIARGVAVADALAAVPHPSVDVVVKHFIASPHPLARAAGILLLGRGARLPADDLRRHLLDPNPAVQHAALRAARSLDATEATPLLALVRISFAFPHRDVAAEAARTLAAWGDVTPCDAVRSDDRAIARLGLHAAEILVRQGGAGDLALLQRILKRTPTSPAHLSIVARFGHPGAWAYLLHHLADPELVDDAADALEALFGTRVDETARESVAAWRSAIHALAPAPGARYAFGEPWHPRALSAKLAAGTLTAAAADLLHAEAMARLGVRAPLDVGAWANVEAGARGAAAAEIAAKEGRYPVGRWAVIR